MHYILHRYSVRVIWEYRVIQDDHLIGFNTATPLIQTKHLAFFRGWTAKKTSAVAGSQYFFHKQFVTNSDTKNGNKITLNLIKSSFFISKITNLSTDDIMDWLYWRKLYPGIEQLKSYNTILHLCRLIKTYF